MFGGRNVWNIASCHLVCLVGNKSVMLSKYEEIRYQVFISDKESKIRSSFKVRYSGNGSYIMGS